MQVKRIVCVHKKAQDCVNCILVHKCVYAYIFDTTPPIDSSKLRKYKDIPRPFIIEPPIVSNEQYIANEGFDFNLILIGKACDYLPYFIFTFKELGDIGIGKGRGKYELTDVVAIKGAQKEGIYSNTGGILRNIDLRITMDDILKEVNSLPDNELTIEFITPCRMKYNARLCNSPEFHILIQNLLARISSLVYFHCNEEINFDFKGLIEEAKQVRIKERHIGWYDWERYSARQDTRMKLGGIIGQVTYAGNLTNFLPFIALGRYLHIGKGTTFGLGKYEIVTKGRKVE
ncbi:MAG: CRISPR system precrRNA processing endoribonuclease RAMP protein Cas6 [bacterium]